MQGSSKPREAIKAFSRSAVNFRYEFKIAIQHPRLKWAKKPESLNVKKMEKIKECISLVYIRYKLKSFLIHVKAKLVCKFKRLHD